MRAQPLVAVAIWGRVAISGLLLGILAALVLSPTRGGAWDCTSAEQELIAFTNAYRTSNSLEALRPQAALGAVARERSWDMATRNYFEHEIPPGGRFFDTLLQAVGIRYRQASENLARNNYPDD